MQTLLNRKQRASCPDALLPIGQLSDNQLLIRQTKTRQMIGVVSMLMVLMILMAFLSGQYFIATTSAAMIPALDDYLKKGKAIAQQLRNRNLR